MNNWKRFVTAILMVAVMLMSVPALAAVEDTGFADVSADAWYADSVAYVKDNGWMSGTASDTFSPDSLIDKAMIASILHRIAGNPEAAPADLSDVTSEAYYASAAAWAVEKNLMTVGDNGAFGGEDAMSREQIATVLWRYVDSPSVEAGQDFADEDSITPDMAMAVDWVRANGVMNGIEGNLFDPQGNVTRAQAAAIVCNFLTKVQAPNTPATQLAENQEMEQTADNTRRSLVVYFSASGNTKTVAGYIAESLGAEQFEITPVDAYTSADLNWTDEKSRVNAEHDNLALRNIALTADTVENWADYDTVFIGYPIWWGIAAWPTDSFVKANDFTGKTIIPFCTSTSSGLGQSGQLLADLAGNGDWQEGHRFQSSASQADVQAWLDSLNLAD